MSGSFCAGAFHTLGRSLSLFASSKKNRAPAETGQVCTPQGEGCPFLIIGHRGAPYIVAENTWDPLKSLKRGANAVEMDISLTKDHHVAIMHDSSPDQFRPHSADRG